MISHLLANHRLSRQAAIEALSGGGAASANCRQMEPVDSDDLELSGTAQ